MSDRTLTLERSPERLRLTGHGTPLTVRLRLLSASSGQALPGYATTLFHCDGPTAHEVTDPAGWVCFASTFPAAGTHEWPHLHFEVHRGAVRVHAAQLVLPGDACAKAHGRHPTGRPTAARPAAGQPTVGQPTVGRIPAVAACPGALEFASVTGDARRGMVAIRTVTV
ncbi:hypothetical protein AB0M02_05790 [Actinoplanes sp. NPDC051861]|uniref:hypothetical protein n=1 Tax=Actinoplanes sp. NPDC051861 TaxID=3155170 RepID=UPI0034435853